MPFNPIKQELSTSQKASLDAANTPSAANAIATIDDIIEMLKGEDYLRTERSVFGTSLIAQYPLSDVKGAVVSDISGNGLNGVVNDVLLKQAGLLGKTSAAYSGATGASACYINIMQAGLASKIDLDEGTISLWFKMYDAGTWADSTNRTMIRLEVDSTNHIKVYKSITEGSVIFQYKGGDAERSITITGLSSTSWNHLVCSWSKSGNALTAQLNGVAATPNICDRTLTGTLALALIGAQTTIVGIHEGWLQFVTLGDRALTAAEMSRLYVAHTDPTVTFPVTLTDTIPSFEYTKADYAAYVAGLTATGCDIEDLGLSSDGVTKVYGLSVGNTDAPAVMITGGIHGDHEWHAQHWIRKFMTYLNDPSTLSTYLQGQINYIKSALHIYAMPLVNPYGYINSTRYNANGVDINRNFDYNWGDSTDEYKGSAAFSEEESVAVRDKFNLLKPILFVDFHTNGTDGSPNRLSLAVNNNSAVMQLNQIVEYMQDSLTLTIAKNYTLDTAPKAHCWASDQDVVAGQKTIGMICEPYQDDTVSGIAESGMNISLLLSLMANQCLKS